MTDYTKSQGYIYANLCSEVSRALYEAMMKKKWAKHVAERRAHGGNMSLLDIARTLAEIGAQMEVTVKFIDAHEIQKGGKEAQAAEIARLRAAPATVRNDALEEAEKVAKALIDDWRNPQQRHGVAFGEAILSAIRAMKDKSDA